jgi:hypothetical protein
MNDLSGKDAAYALENFINKASKEDLEEFTLYIVDTMHRTLQQKLMRVLVVLIRRWGKMPPGGYDLRNESTIKLCQRLTLTLAESSYLPFI